MADPFGISPPPAPAPAPQGRAAARQRRLRWEAQQQQMLAIVNRFFNADTGLYDYAGAQQEFAKLFVQDGERVPSVQGFRR